MNAIIDFLNLGGGKAWNFFTGMFLQSSILILVLLLVDRVIRARARASFRYALACLVLVKLVLPPSLTCPISVVSWWPSAQAIQQVTIVSPTREKTEISKVVGANVQTASRQAQMKLSRPELTWKGAVIFGWSMGVLGLFFWVLHRTRVVSGMVKNAKKAPDLLYDLANECQRQLGVRKSVDVKITDGQTSPAVCGVLRPVILIPELLVNKMSPAQLRAVLLHEMAHVKRADSWWNSIQTLLQIAYWWHPFLWLANVHIRRLREEAADECVMVALKSESDIYPLTLLEVAKVTLVRPFLALGLIGILESPSALKERIQKLINRPIPASARVGWRGALVILVSAWLLLPMARAEKPVSLKESNTNRQVSFEIQLIKLPPSEISKLALNKPVENVKGTNWILSPKEAVEFQKSVDALVAVNKMVKSVRMRMSSLIGRECRVSCSDAVSVVTGVEVQTNKHEINYITEKMPFGPSVELQTALSDNGEVLHVEAKAELSTFYGYDKPSETKKVKWLGKEYEKAEPISYVPPIPAIKKFELESALDVANGSMMVFSGLTDASVIGNMSTNINVLAEAKSKQLLVLLTPTLINEFGLPSQKSQASAETVYWCGTGTNKNPKAFPVITREMTEKAIVNNKFTINTALQVLKNTPTNAEMAVGFDKTFVDAYGIKGITLFRAASLILEGRDACVRGVVGEPLIIGKPEKAGKRVFKVNPTWFEKGIRFDPKSNWRLPASTIMEDMEMQFKCSGIDADKVEYSHETGKLTIKASAEGLDRAESLVLDCNQPNDNRHLEAPPVRLPVFLFKFLICRMTSDAFEELQLGKSRELTVGEYWQLDPVLYDHTVSLIKDGGKMEVLSRPRLQACIGCEGSMCVGNEEGNISLDSLSLMKKNDLSMLLRLQTVGAYGSKGQTDWPNALGATNVALWGEVHLPDGGGAVLRVKRQGLNPTNQFVVLVSGEPVAR